MKSYTYHKKESPKKDSIGDIREFKGKNFLKIEECYDINSKTKRGLWEIINFEHTNQPIPRVDKGCNYWVMVLDNLNNIVPKQRIDQGVYIVDNNPISYNRIDELYSSYRNYFYSEESCLNHINKIKNG